jgi:hypothetical protein
MVLGECEESGSGERNSGRTVSPCEGQFYAGDLKTSELFRV